MTTPQARIIPSTKLMRHPFTTDERVEFGQQLSQALNDQREVADELATLKAQYKSKESEVAGRINLLANKITTGYEMREVKVNTVIDLISGKVQVIRIDTGEVVEEREAKDSEHQLVLEVAKDSALDTLDKALADAASQPRPPCPDDAPCCENRGQPLAGAVCPINCPCHDAPVEPEAPPEDVKPDEPKPEGG